MDTDIIKYVFWVVVFPGFLFSIVIGLGLEWIIRKVTAMIHHRIGPPILQPLYDVIKLIGKEVLIPDEANQNVFILAPLIGLSGIVLLSTMLWRITFAPAQPFVGDALVAIYLLVLPSLALILGSSASASPHGAIGTSREMKLVISYELPLVLAFTVVIIKTADLVGAGQQLNLSAIASHASALSISGMIAFIVALLCIQAKLGFVPFDMAEAETEIASGIMIEYSGALLAIWKLMQAIMLVVLPLFLVILFLGGFGATFPAILAGLGKLVFIVVLIILIKNTNPRVRIDQAMRFFWFYCSPALVIAIVLATIGHYLEIGWL